MHLRVSDAAGSPNRGRRGFLLHPRGGVAGAASGPVCEVKKVQGGFTYVVACILWALTSANGEKDGIGKWVCICHIWERKGLEGSWALACLYLFFFVFFTCDLCVRRREGQPAFLVVCLLFHHHLRGGESSRIHRAVRQTTDIAVRGWVGSRLRSS